MAQPKPSSSAAAGSATRVKRWLLRQRQQSPRVFWSAVALLGLLLLAFLLVVGLILAVWLGAFGSLPNRATLAAIENPEASYLLDRNGEVLSRYYLQNREIAELDEIPPVLIEALVSTEDERFFQHHGIDWQATARAIIYSVVLRKREQGGGSTLSQQLAKQHFPRAEGKGGLVVAKIKEAFVANRLEDEFDKEELLALYLNTVDYGENMYGVKVAAQRFFGADLYDLTTEQAAVLVGMLKATTAYNPVLHPQKALGRRNLVLRRMLGQDFITKEAYDTLTQLPLVVQEGKSSILAQTSHLSQRAKTDVNNILVGLAETSKGNLDLYTSGLRVYTTIDQATQEMAEAAVKATLAELQPKFFEHWAGRKPSGFDALLAEAIRSSHRYQQLLEQGKSDAVAMASFGESRTITYSSLAALPAGERQGTWSDSVRAELLRLRAGFVVADAKAQELRAYVGGSDYQAVPFDGAAARRQVGSTFKPLVYAAAIEKGVAACDYWPNELRTYTDFKEWTPENADGEYGGEYSTIGGLVNSVNTVAVQLAFRAGPEYVQQLAEQIGLAGVPAEPSIALGTPSLSAEDMVRLYGMFVRQGTVPRYQLVTRIETRLGEVLYEAEAPRQRKQVVSRRTAELLDYALRQVALRGTGSSLYSRFGVQSEVAGKTGTTQNQADGWFCGYTDNVVVGAWVGGAYPAIRWRSLSLGQGARTALPIVGRFLRSYERKYGVSQLPELQEDILLDTECDDFIDLASDSLLNDERVNFAEIFEDLFRKRRKREQARVPVDKDERERRNQALAERRRQREEALRDAERDRRREERRERRRAALEKIFGEPD